MAATTGCPSTTAGDPIFKTTNGSLAARPYYIGDAQLVSSYFRRVEPAVVFGAIDTGVPNQAYNDQFFVRPAAEVPFFFPLFAVFELVFYLLVFLWAVRALWSRSSSSSGTSTRGGVGVSGSAELLLFVYGLETAFITFTCIYDAALWDPAVVSFKQKTVLIGRLYGGYFALAVLMTIDMYGRVLKRVGTAEVKKTQ
ncbi:hypothetical protein F5Y14DRAFT_457653 [Nemania sp. NC0429]|nr:hypothetical protein F5Y14DRAFT_457653 [Nemania sp. NC0429]